MGVVLYGKVRYRTVRYDFFFLVEEGSVQMVRYPYRNGTVPYNTKDFKYYPYTWTVTYGT